MASQDDRESGDKLDEKPDSIKEELGKKQYLAFIALAIVGALVFASMINAEIQERQECQEKFGEDNWFKGDGKCFNYTEYRQKAKEFLLEEKGATLSKTAINLNLTYSQGSNLIHKMQTEGVIDSINQNEPYQDELFYVEE